MMKVKVKKMSVSQSCPALCYSMGLAHQATPCNSPAKNTGVGSHSLLQGICKTQELNSGLLH